MKIQLSKTKCVDFINKSVASIDENISELQASYDELVHEITHVGGETIKHLEQILGNITYSDMVNHYSKIQTKEWNESSFFSKAMNLFKKDSSEFYTSYLSFREDGTIETNHHYVELNYVSMRMIEFFEKYIQLIKSMDNLEFSQKAYFYCSEISYFLRDYNNSDANLINELREVLYILKGKIENTSKYIKQLETEKAKLIRNIEVIDLLGVDDELIEVKISGGHCTFSGGNLC